MKLELKHLVGYLPYGLNCQATTKQKSMFKLSSLRTSDDLKYYKPILHPLSDLTKEVEIGGEKFVPIIELSKIEFKEVRQVIDYVTDENYILGKHCGVEFLSRDRDIIKLVFSQRMQIFCFDNKSCNTGLTPCLYNAMMRQKLYEWHFDIHNLIGEGLAIDINTLKS